MQHHIVVPDEEQAVDGVGVCDWGMIIGDAEVEGVIPELKWDLLSA